MTRSRCEARGATGSITHKERQKLLFGKEEDGEAEVLSSEDVKEGSIQSRVKNQVRIHKKRKSTHFFRIRKGT